MRALITALHIAQEDYIAQQCWLQKMRKYMLYEDADVLLAKRSEMQKAHSKTLEKIQYYQMRVEESMPGEYYNLDMTQLNPMSHAWAAQLHWMAPGDFLAVAGDGTFSYRHMSYSTISYRNVLHRMQLGQPIDNLELDVRVAGGKVVGHEGRHRSLAAHDLGIEEVPVILYFRDTHGNYFPAPEKRYDISLLSRQCNPYIDPC